MIYAIADMGVVIAVFKREVHRDILYDILSGLYPGGKIKKVEVKEVMFS